MDNMQFIMATGGLFSRLVADIDHTLIDTAQNLDAPEYMPAGSTKAGDEGPVFSLAEREQNLNG